MSYLNVELPHLKLYSPTMEDAAFRVLFSNFLCILWRVMIALQPVTGNLLMRPLKLSGHLSGSTAVYRANQLEKLSLPNSPEVLNSTEYFFDTCAKFLQWWKSTKAWIPIRCELPEQIEILNVNLISKTSAYITHTKKNVYTLTPFNPLKPISITL